GWVHRIGLVNIKAFLRPVAALARGLGRVLAFFLGSVSLGWSAPPWLRGVGRRPRLVIVSLLLLGGGAYGGLRWWQWHDAHRARPRQLTATRKIEAKLSPPGVPTLDLATGKMTAPSFGLDFTKDAAPIEIIGRLGAP